MQYRDIAYKCRVHSVIDLKDDVVPVGVVQAGEDLFVICLDPLEERRLAEEVEKEKEKEKPGGD